MDFPEHRIHGTAAECRERFLEGTPGFLTVEMGVNEDRLLRFVTVEDMVLRGVDEAIEILFLLLFRMEDKESMDCIAEDRAVHVHRVPLHHSQVLQPFDAILRCLAREEDLFPSSVIDMRLFFFSSLIIFLSVSSRVFVSMGSSFFGILCFIYYTIKKELRVEERGLKSRGFAAD